MNRICLTMIFIGLLMTLSCRRSANPAETSARDYLLTVYVDILKQDAAAGRNLSAADTLRVSADPEKIRTAIRYLNERPERWNRFFRDAGQALGATPLKPDTSGIRSLLRKSMLNKSSAAAHR